MELVEARMQDWEILLEWRNDSFTRKNSITSDIISKKEHKEWFSNILKDPNSKIYIVKEKNKPIGTVRADKNDDEIIISWTVAPESRGKGYGKQMVKLLVENLSGKVTAIIKNENSASIKVAEFAGLSLELEKDNILFYSITK